jgi:hypothetical protein
MTMQINRPCWSLRTWSDEPLARQPRASYLRKGPVSGKRPRRSARRPALTSLMPGAPFVVRLDVTRRNRASLAACVDFAAGVRSRHPVEILRGSLCSTHGVTAFKRAEAQPLAEFPQRVQHLVLNRTSALQRPGVRLAARLLPLARGSKSVSGAITQATPAAVPTATRPTKIRLLIFEDSSLAGLEENADSSQAHSGRSNYLHTSHVRALADSRLAGSLTARRPARFDKSVEPPSHVAFKAARNGN